MAPEKFSLLAGFKGPQAPYVHAHGAHGPRTPTEQSLALRKYKSCKTSPTISPHSTPASPVSGSIFDLADKQARINELEAQSSDPELWNDPRVAQEIMQRLTRLRTDVSQWSALEEQLNNLAELLTLASEEEEDSALQADLVVELTAVRDTLDRGELALLLSGRYDEGDTFISIQAGMGGTDAQDWAEMLLRMYTRWAETRGFTVNLVDRSEGEEAGLKSATLEVRGPYAYGYARAEAGVHRLIRLSPFNANHTRQTSFARIEVLPEVDDAPEVVILPDDLRTDVFRSGGKGGQGVNTTDSAVRLTHLPSGIVVTCQNERSQIQNRETALRVLRGRLLERELQRQAEDRARMRGAYRDAAFGSQMRTYYLHPSTLVKDHRTNHETSNVHAVLDGQIDSFIEAFLRWNVTQEG
ncbi:MAG: peptide chain release factor 2 [Candidatus Viridilinea halotolerans]|uniref:Peptide chain release factor 2 n=1 Tax=Candidatus Viridilinea halotolerans TaxID=2491704 RepID=A0A426U3L8_9CHLR|nr:MAG: peptide chain release factor 2 [Candidatus Viridilinea halotolerans]